LSQLEVRSFILYVSLFYFHFDVIVLLFVDVTSLQSRFFLKIFIDTVEPIIKRLFIEQNDKLWVVDVIFDFVWVLERTSIIFFRWITSNERNR
jgi:hypothetical protein